MLAGISKPLIFVVISVLFVALIYSSFASFVVFAVPQDPGFLSSKDCTTKHPDADTTEVTCCWRERVPGQILGKEYCQTCKSVYGGPSDCTEKKPQALEQPPTSSPFDPTAPLQGGVLEQQQQTPQTGAPGTSPGILEQLEQGGGLQQGFFEQQQPQPPAEQGAVELPPPTTEEAQPATVEEEQPVPVCQEGLEFNEYLGFCVPTECPEGQELNEETGICVPIECPQGQVLDEETGLCFRIASPQDAAQEQEAAEDQPQEVEEPEEQQQTEEEQPSEESGSEEDNSNN